MTTNLLSTATGRLSPECPGHRHTSPKRKRGTHDYIPSRVPSGWLRASVGLLGLGLVLAFATAAWACPGCKDALDTSENGGDLRAGFFWSILFMLSMPPLILAGLGTAMYLSVRRARAAQAAGQPLTPAVGAALHTAVPGRNGAPVSAPIGTSG
jgi:hypothetical protein